MKTCSHCRLEKPAADFHRAPNTRDKLSTICKSCKKEYNDDKYSRMTPEDRVEYNKKARDRYRLRVGGLVITRTDTYKDSAATIKKIKTDKGCLRCGESDYYALDFHHVSDKVVGIGNGRNSKHSVIVDEIPKCIVLCSNCHRKLHSGSWQLSDLYAKMESEYHEAYLMLQSVQ